MKKLNLSDSDDINQEPLTQEHGCQACFGPLDPADETTTLGIARDQIVFLTEQLARKDKLLAEYRIDSEHMARGLNEVML